MCTRCFSDGRPLRGCWEGKGRLVEESQFCEESRIRRFNLFAGPCTLQQLTQRAELLVRISPVEHS